jgi:hypothetical protein
MWRKKKGPSDQLIGAVMDAFPPPPDDAPGPFKERYYRELNSMRRGECSDCHARREDSPHKAVDGHVAFQIALRHAPTCPLRPANLELYAGQLGYVWHKESMQAHLMKVKMTKDGKVLDVEP